MDTHYLSTVTRYRDEQPTTIGVYGNPVDALDRARQEKSTSDTDATCHVEAWRGDTKLGTLTVEVDTPVSNIITLYGLHFIIKGLDTTNPGAGEVTANTFTTVEGVIDFVHGEAGARYTNLSVEVWVYGKRESTIGRTSPISSDGLRFIVQQALYPGGTH